MPQPWSIAVWRANCTVANPPGKPKPHSECQPFSFDLAPVLDESTIALQEKIVQRINRELAKAAKKRTPAKGVVVPWQPTLESWRQAA